MLDFDIVLLIFCLLVILQTIVGVGVLVVGTPTLLFLGYEIVEILSILLPISITTSFINLIYFKFLNKNIKLKIDREYRISFFGLCIPAIILGLYTIKIYGDYLNFKYLVSLVILISFIITTNKQFIANINKLKKSISLITIGFIHGLTNSGGSLLSLFLSSYLNWENSRFNITYFYFFLATIQYLIFNFIFKNEFSVIKITTIFPIILVGIIFGNFLVKYLSNNAFKLIVNLLSVLTFFLLLE